MKRYKVIADGIIYSAGKNRKTGEIFEAEENEELKGQVKYGHLEEL